MAEKTTKEQLNEVRQEVYINQHALEKCHEDLENAKKSVHAKEKTLIALNSDLEEMMFAISHKVRNFVANIVAVSTLINEDDTLETEELKEISSVGC